MSDWGKSGKWEYHREVVPAPSTGLSTLELNDLGNQGWELVMFREYKKNSDDSIMEQFAGKLVAEYTFKRKL